MPVCPQCDSYNRTGAAFCSQCGGQLSSGSQRLPPPATSKRPRRTIAAAAAGALLLALVVVLVLVVRPVDTSLVDPLPEEEGRAGDAVANPPAATSSDGDEPSGPREATLEVLAPLLPLGAREASQRLTPSLVVLEFFDDKGRRWSETRGVLVSGEGVVLCRYHPLLGAYRGVARLPDRTSDRAEILGVSAYLVAEDLALVRLRSGQREYAAAPLADARIDELFDRGDELYVFSNYRALLGIIAETRYGGSDGLLRARLESDDALPPEVFLAIDPFGTVVGLCRVEADGRLLEPSAKLPRSGYRIVVDSVSPLARALELETFTTLEELTFATYEGTFAAHVRRGEEAHREQRWSEAINAFANALEQVPYEVPPAQEVQRVAGLLADDYVRYIRALLAEDRSRDALLVSAAAVERLPEEASLWILRGASGLKTGEPAVESVQALLRAKGLGAPAEQWRDLLEEGYLLVAQSAQAVGDVRSEESSLLEGMGHIPDSAALALALARLYYRIEAFDDVEPLLAQVDRIDSRLRSATDELRRRIDEVIKDRNSVVIPISREDRSYRADVVVDGQLRAGFIIDTGASFTAIPHDLARQLGYDLSGSERIALSTASGVISAPRIQLSSLDVNGYTVRNIRVVVLPPGVGPREGLLGLNFLRHFKYTVDASRNEFRLQRP